jgi:organic radical activating enzyme
MATESLCNICYKVIPADIAIGDIVYIIKECKEHGVQIGIVERSPIWYDCCKTINSSKFYDGYLIDITNACNISCRYCYHPNREVFRSVEDIVADATENVKLVPFILTGGEPTWHPELERIIVEISKLGETFLLSNGILIDQKMLEMFCNNGLLKGNMLNVGLSFHKESEGKDFEMLELLRKEKLRLYTAFYVIDDLKQIDKVIRIYEENSDVIDIMRIKAASNIWNEQRAVNKIFTSDMLNYFYSKGNTVIDSRCNQKTSYAGLLHNNLTYRLISWYDKYNVDLHDIDCPPYYRAKDGHVYDFVKAMLLNERTSR